MFKYLYLNDEEIKLSLSYSYFYEQKEKLKKKYEEDIKNHLIICKFYLLEFDSSFKSKELFVLFE